MPSSVYSLAWLHTHPWPACSILSTCRPGRHFLLIQTTWDSCCGVSRQKREPQPPSGCQGGWQEGASPPGVSWETASSPEKGHLEIKFLPLCVCMCVGVGERVKKPPQPPLLFSLQGKPLPAVFLTCKIPVSLPANSLGSAGTGQTTWKVSLQIHDTSGVEHWTESQRLISLAILPHPGQYTHFLSPGFLLCKMRVLAEISPSFLVASWGSSTRPQNTVRAF